LPAADLQRSAKWSGRTRPPRTFKTVLHGIFSVVRLHFSLLYGRVIEATRMRHSPPP